MNNLANLLYEHVCSFRVYTPCLKKKLYLELKSNLFSSLVFSIVDKHCDEKLNRGRIDTVNMQLTGIYQSKRIDIQREVKNASCDLDTILDEMVCDLKKGVLDSLSLYEEL